MRTGSKKAVWAAMMMSVSLMACDNDVSKHEEASNGLPTIVRGEDSEDATPAPVSVCDWAQSGDVLVMGSIANVRLEDSPVVGSRRIDGEEDLTPRADCDGLVEGALAIDLDVDEVLWNADSATPDTFTFYVGRDRWVMFNPYPAAQKSDGSIVWENARPSDLGAPLQVGQRVGVLAHAVPGMDADGQETEDEQWSLLGESMFYVDAQDRVVFQKDTSETQGIPVNEETLTLEGLTDTLAGCDAVSTVAKARQAQMNRMWGPASGRASAYRAGMCFNKDADGEALGCDVSEACPADQHCEDGRCVP